MSIEDEGMDWPQIEFGRVIKGKLRHGLYKSPEFFGRGVPIIKMGTQSANQFIRDEHITDRVDILENEIQRYQVYEKDLLFLRTSLIMEGTGKCSLIKKISRPTVFVSNLIAASIDEAKGDSEFYFYYFTSNIGRKNVLSMCEQTAAATIRSSDLNKLNVPYPSLLEQRAIAHILGSLDDKIELNRRINETLEEMAQALFKSWFMDFDPVRAKAEGRDPGLPKHIADLFPDRFVNSEIGAIPEGWNIKSLDEIAIFLNGLAMQKYPPEEDRSLPVIKIAQLRAGKTIGADRASAYLDADYIVMDGDILFSWSGSLECVLWAGGEGALNQHLFKVTSSTYPRWLCYLGIHAHLNDFRRIAEGKATTMGHIQRHHLSDAKISVPPAKLLEVMNKYFEPIIESLWKRMVESRNLATLRDALLPKLISGDIRI